MGGSKSAITDEASAYGESLYDLLFVRHIEEQRSVTENENEKNKLREATGDNMSVIEPPVSPLDLSIISRSHRVWDIKECRSKFLETIRKFQVHRREDIGTLQFDKDDGDSMDFVAAASCLRMFCFRIPLMSRWDIQSIAGAIIPAVASTNAIVGGLQACQLIHLLFTIRRLQNSQKDENTMCMKTIKDETNARFVWVKQFTAGDRLVLIPEPLTSPNPKCFVCQQKKLYVTLRTLDTWNLGQWIKTVAVAGLGCVEPLVEFGGERKCIHDPDTKEDDPDLYASQMSMSLPEWGFVHNSLLFVTDMGQDFQCDVIIRVDDQLSEDVYPLGFRYDTEQKQDEGGANR
eukprot:GHVO01044105.1.p1 GENE.GHVO01044105.1~~GHVO01044105.1.p1  ORF type:complete len:363 (-),score=65.36 GHVO01044105.1:205-1242(-)